ncbi:hypothetical protein [Neobacillus soli]|uniref:hypothetical protein n=1 Tax=Neobacillus soli TaxID=220688 RepID=UPI000826CF20|nr:hypothetical protein [Neobacillus soli]
MKKKNKPFKWIKKQRSGDTAEQKDRPMLELKFQNLSADGLMIKKLVKTSKGVITIDMSPEDAVFFNTLSLNVTNAGFGNSYLPTNGNIGLKDVKLLAHRVTSDSSSIPKFNLRFVEGGQVEMEPKSEEELLQLKAGLEQLLKISQP